MKVQNKIIEDSKISLESDEGGVVESFGETKSSVTKYTEGVDMDYQVEKNREWLEMVSGFLL